MFLSLQEEAREHLNREKEERAMSEASNPPKSDDGPTVVKKKKLVLDWENSDSEEEAVDFGIVKDDILREFENYRAEPEMSKDEDDILQWWRERRTKYPNLARLARKYLCVPATSTQAERVYSALGWLLNKRRLCLTGSHVNNLMFLKDNIRY